MFGIRDATNTYFNQLICQLFFQLIIYKLLKYNEGAHYIFFSAQMAWKYIENWFFYPIVKTQRLNLFSEMTEKI